VKKFIAEKDFYTINELSKVLGISRISVFKRVRRGSIKGQKMGNNYIIFKKDIDLKRLMSKIRY
jgi:excisionase family DNA binding protein